MAEEKKTTEEEWESGESVASEDSGENESLEDLFDELDEILAALDDRDISLEDSFALYEKGMKKVHLLNDKLDQVEKKMLVIAADGSEAPLDE